MKGFLLIDFATIDISDIDIYHIYKVGTTFTIDQPLYYIFTDIKQILLSINLMNNIIVLGIDTLDGTVVEENGEHYSDKYKITKIYSNSELWSMFKYELDKLVKDPDPLVRQTVARLGYGLGVLRKDSNPLVRQTASDAINNKTTDIIG